MAIYKQDAYSKELTDTCAWRVVAGHTGDINQCVPDPNAPVRPPARRLLSDDLVAKNITLPGNDTAFPAYLDPAPPETVTAKRTRRGIAQKRYSKPANLRLGFEGLAGV